MVSAIAVRHLLRDRFQWMLLSKQSSRQQQQGFAYLRSFSAMPTNNDNGGRSNESNTSSNNKNGIDKYLSRCSSLRRPSAIRKLQPLVSQPGMISLGGGLPNPSLFPISDIRFQLKSVANKQQEQEIVLTGQEVAMALQYSNTSGLPGLRTQLLDLQQREHRCTSENNKTYDMDLTITVGSQDGFCKAIEMLIDSNGAESNDTIFLESPTYSGALAFLHPYEANLVPVPIDQHGLIPSKLKDALVASPRKGKRVLYTIPTAQNPSGATLSKERRYEIYNLAQEHDLIILEDDPYYFLHPHRHTLPSFLEIDREAVNKKEEKIGRVIRFDSVSKLISSGLRVGFVTGPKPFVEKLNYHIQGTNLHNCGVSQMMLANILEHWGSDGFDEHCQQVAEFYTQRRNVMMEACRKHLTPQNLAEWHVPEAGMFVWMKLPTISDTKALIEEKAAKANVLLVPGAAFDPIPNQPSQYVRASFSTASDENIDIAMERLATLIKENS